MIDELEHTLIFFSSSIKCIGNSMIDVKECNVRYLYQEFLF